MDPLPDVMEPRLWRRAGWTALVKRNEEEYGWSVEMTATRSQRSWGRGRWGATRQQAERATRHNELDIAGDDDDPHAAKGYRLPHRVLARRAGDLSVTWDG